MKRNTVSKVVMALRAPVELIDDYLEGKRLAGVTQFTLDNQKSTLNRFFRDCAGVDGQKQWEKAVCSYLLNKRNSYFNKELDTLRQFWDYCVEEQVISKNPCQGIHFRPHASRIVDHSQGTVRKLLKMPDRTTFAGLRDYTLMLLILDTGIRPQEALRLKVTDIRFQDKNVLVREEYAKTRKARYLPLSISTIHALKRLIESRHSAWKDECPVFCSFSGKPLETRELQDRFRIYAKKIGASITPYQLRHVFALGFVRNGGDPFTLQAIMGHTKLDQTRNYINLVKLDIMTAHEKATPLGQFMDESRRVGGIRV